ncbi:MAG TPA: hypothetical protein VG738_13120 [Chitinophagaceae bacterium]|nr:hypothetical protein [Chitinophagaceae bacterium]
MTKKHSTKLFAVLIFFVLFCKASAQDTVKDYLHVPGPVTFDSTDYHLIWSSHPLPDYYKQEYLAKGDSLEHFNRLVLVDLLFDDSLKPKDLVYQEIRGLESRKKFDAVVQYNLIQSPDSTEYVLDFAESEGAPLIKFVEWNAYLYKPYTDQNGHKGVILLGVSTRSYGNSTADFMGTLPALREKIIQQLMAYPVPRISVNAQQSKKGAK